MTERWLSLDEIEALWRRYDRPDEWRRHYLNEWCGCQVELHGHYLPCILERGHDSDCVPGPLARHLRDGVCTVWRCPNA